MTRFRGTSFGFAAFCCLLTITSSIFAQTSTPPNDSNDDDGGFTIRDGDIGYIDSAIIGDHARLRFDATYGTIHANRAEYLYAQSQPGGPGLPTPEVSIDYQEFQFYLEKQTNDWLSLFVEFGTRGLNPIVNENTAGLGDVNLGTKVTLFETVNGVSTAQLRVYTPTGDVNRGLGTGHVSIEPAILGLYRLDRRWTVAGELRYWTAINGSEFAGDVFQYGIGLQYSADRCCWIEPVTELVGWTVLTGKKTTLDASNATVFTDDAGGDTIINAKLGARINLTCDKDLYIGFGRSLTGDHWYANTLRAELRFVF